MELWRIPNKLFKKRYPGGKLEIQYDLNQGKLKTVKLFGDFLDIGNITSIENSLDNQEYVESSIRKALKQI